ncbi:hypothetical protein [Pontibacter lucknowensis]|uniref:ABC-2 family transporter protein n=1 Tax=Pontibacter lucknowensis TaxID=1077936 RepID=A0A1N6YHZ6_9BACT|nr:hypothetical protein [Pontibacter lucknowensis]SIR14255.1 hypothetical protein SAMN05421545_2501 [Pontibacter lucknowensis]
MKNHFNLSRFGLLFRKHTVEHYKTYLMALGVLLGGMFVTMGTINYLSARTIGLPEQSIFFFFFLIGAGMVFTSTVFAQLGDKKKAIAFLTLPASQLEKYLVGWLFSFPIYLLLFVPSFYLVLYTLLSIDPRVSGEPEMLNVLTSEPSLQLLLIFYALFNAVMLTGSVYFNKNHFIKTAFAGLLGILLFYNLNKLWVQFMLGRDLVSAGPFSAAMFVENDQRFEVGAYEGNEPLILALVVMLACIGWVVAYFKIKEKQV